jgi:hypothetical protein
MAIPVGKTGRQLAAIARWVLAGVVVIGMLTWWWPEYRTWGALAIGLLVVWTLWLAWKTLVADRRVPGHPVYLALLGPVGVLVFHLASTGLGVFGREGASLHGAINMSMIFQLALLALGVMLTQSLLPEAASHAAVLSVCGAAMVGGMIAAVASGRAEHVRGALAMLGFAGVCVWLTPLWRQDGGDVRVPPSRRKELRILYGSVAVLAVGATAWFSPWEGLTACAIVAGVAVFLVVASAGRWALAAAFVVLTIGAAATLVFHDALPNVPEPACGQQWWYGRGELAFDHVSGADSGLGILLATIGWGGVVWLSLGLSTCLLLVMRGLRGASRADKTRVGVWSAAAAMCTAAMLSPGGLVLPATTLAAAFTWGLLPMMAGRPPKERTGLTLLVLMVALVLLLGLADNDGLVDWIAHAFRGDDRALHGVVGFLVAMVMAWLMGSRSVWWGLAGIVLAGLSGGAGEVAQGVASRRGMELGDWAWHAWGSAAAILPYLLCMGARLCESVDAKEVKLDAYAGYGRW